MITRINSNINYIEYKVICYELNVTLNNINSYMVMEYINIRITCEYLIIIL